MVLYQSAKGGGYRLRDFYFVFDLHGPNMSEPTFAMEIDPKNGREVYTIIKGGPMSSPDKKNWSIVHIIYFNL